MCHIQVSRARVTGICLPWVGSAVGGMDAERRTMVGNATRVEAPAGAAHRGGDAGGYVYACVRYVVGVCKVRYAVCVCVFECTQDVCREGDKRTSKQGDKAIE